LFETAVRIGERPQVIFRNELLHLTDPHSRPPMQPQTLLRTSILAVGLAVCSSAQSRLIGIDTSGSNVYDIDPATGARTLVGPIVGASSTIGALAYDDTSGVLYVSSTGNDSLYTLDLATLTTTLVGPYNIGATVVMHGLEDVPATGKLYGKSSSLAGAGDFFEIDKVTGQATPISALGFGGFGSLSYVNGTMYAADTVGDNLHTVDLTTGVATLVGPFGLAGAIGIGLANSAATGLLATDNTSDSLYRINLMTGAATLIGAQGAGNIISLEFVPGGPVGTPYCQAAAVPNTTGLRGRLEGSGSATVAANDLVLNASDLPANQFGFFLTSQVQGFVPNPGGSQGNLCLAGTIGRYVGAGQIQNAGAAGAISLALDLTQTPAGPVFVSIAAGETWNFQAWFRDIGPSGQPWSNFTNGLNVVFN